MASSFSFKLDQNSLPKLSSRGDNFTEWRSAWTIAFRYANLWNLVNGKAKRPTTEGELQDTWDASDNKALVMLLTAVDSDLTLNITTCDSAPAAWSYLAGRYDRDTGNTAIHLFRVLTNLRHNDGDDLRMHIDDFHQLWIRLSKRCSSSTHSVAKAMKPLFESDEVKGSFFLTTLPDTMDHIIDNLSTRNVTSFIDIEPKMLDLAQKHSLDVLDNSSLTAIASKSKPLSKGRNSTPSALQPSSSTTPKNNKECTWCRKHDFTFTGHIYTDCKRLKAQKASQKDKDKPTTKRAKDSRANAVVIDLDESDMEVNAFIATNINKNGKRSRLAVSTTKEQPMLIPSPTPLVTAQAFPASHNWLLDSGASRHMSGNIDDFTTLYPQTGTITIAGQRKIPINGKGTVCFTSILPDGSTSETELTNVLYSKDLRQTRLFSWPYVRNKGCELQGKGDNLFLLKPNGRHLLWAKFKQGVMEIQTQPNLEPSTSQVSATASGNFATFEEFHNAIGHFHVKRPERIYKDFHLIPPRPADFSCEQCSLSKSVHSKPPPKTTPTNIKSLQIVHSDLSGKFSRPSLNRSRYFISFIDEATRFTWVRFLRTKSDASRTIQEFFTYLRTQFPDATTQTFKTDNGGEYMESSLQQFLKNRGIIHNTSPPYHHESNGLPERFNRTVITAAQTMLPEDSLLFLWAEAIHTATFLKNIASHAALGASETPYHALFGRKPKVQHLHPFGVNVHVHIPQEARKPGTKLLHRAEKGVFVGYGKSTKTFRIYIPDRNVIMESRDVKFQKFVPPNLDDSPLELLEPLTEKGETVKSSSKLSTPKTQTLDSVTQTTKMEPSEAPRSDPPSRTSRYGRKIVPTQKSLGMNAQARGVDA